METFRIVLGEAEFRDLVAGRIATVRQDLHRGAVAFQIILSDIGFARMMVAIDDSITSNAGAGGKE